MQIIRCGKRHLTEGIDLTNQEKIRTHGEKGTYKFLGILEADTIKEVGVKKYKGISQESEKTVRDQIKEQKSHLRDKRLGC